MKRSLISLAIFLVLVVLVSLPSSPSVDDDSTGGAGEETFYNAITVQGYSGNPDGGDEPPTVSETVVVEQGTDLLTFSLSWVDDEPRSDPEIFSLTVGDGVEAETVSGSTSPLSIHFEGDLSTQWDAEVTLEEAGMVPGGITGRNPLLSTPDDGNDWELGVSYSGMVGKKKDNALGFTLTGTDGKVFNLDDHLGEVVVVDLTMRCPPCTDQIKELIPVDSKYGDEVTIISVDTTGADNDVIRTYKEETGGTWMFARDTDRVVQKLQMTSMRKLVIIDPEGNIVYTDSEVVAEKELVEEMDSALEGRSSAISIGSLGIAGLALLAGVSAFFAPCAMPLLPGFLIKYMEGSNVDEEPSAKKNRTIDALASGASIGLGAAVFYVFIGVLIALFGAAFANVLPIFGIVMAGIVIVVGASFVMGKHLSLSMLSYRIKKTFGIDTASLEEQASKASSILVEEENRGLFVYGLGYGAASSACHGVLLISVVLLASAGGALMGLKAVLLWSLGLLTMLLISFFLASFAKDKMLNKLTSWISTMNRIAGVALVIGGGLMLFYLI